MPPRTRYVRNGDVHIAYQVVGDGPIDLVYVPSWISQVEHYWEEPTVARYFQRLASFSRLIMFDRRGTGLSDPVAGAPTLEEQMDDVVAVMDAAGSERAAVFARLEGGAMAALFAATHPERDAGARALRGDAADVVGARTTTGRSSARSARRGCTELATGARARGSSRSRRASAANPRLRRLVRRGSSGSRPAPGTAAKLDADERARSTSAACCRRSRCRRSCCTAPSDQFIDIRHSRYLAEHIPGAQLRRAARATTAVSFARRERRAARRDRGVPDRRRAAAPSPSGCSRP